MHGTTKLLAATPCTSCMHPLYAPLQVRYNLCLKDEARRNRGEADLCWCVGGAYARTISNGCLPCHKGGMAVIACHAPSCFFRLLCQAGHTHGHAHGHTCTRMGTTMGSTMATLMGTLMGKLICTLMGTTMGSTMGSTMGTLMGILMGTLMGTLVGTQRRYSWGLAAL